MLKRLIAPVLVCLVFAGLLVATPAASADPNPPGCPREYVCGYQDWEMTGPPVLATPRNWQGNLPGVRAVFNNGVPLPGLDHVQLDYRWPSGEGGSVCLHYNPGPGHTIRFDADVVITRARWRGECS